MRNIVQYSLPRTGSTLICRVLDSLFPEELENLAQHPPLHYNSRDALIVSSCRYPLDVLVSYASVHHCEQGYELGGIDEDLLAHHAKRIKTLYQWYFKDLDHHRGHILQIKYEKFWNNYDYIFDNLETFFSIEIDDNKRHDITQECGIENSRKIQAELVGEEGTEDFGCVDQKTSLHGNHIFAPEPFGYKKVLTRTQTASMKMFLKDAIKEWEKI